jgi:acyl carrier protein
MGGTPDKSIAEGEVNALVREAFAYAVPERQELAPTLPLDTSLEALGIQSIEAFEMAGYLEEKLGIEFVDDELGSIAKLSDLVALVMKRMR